ncbi:MAG: hypothetical protein BGO67_09510 [Alphaproteobacteria bacterium 41-28]|nr:MAG: hypothetical protein BGO67_09510 [Alphaproteobacteria bacterium 41-28]
MYKRPLYQKILNRVNEHRNFIQVLAGPRQVGKSTLAQQIISSIDIPSHYASTSGSSLQDAEWIIKEWQICRQLALKKQDAPEALLVLDEIQNITNWSDTVKKLWDEDSAQNLNLKVLLLGSATLLIQSGLGNSLTGRFEVIPCPHWSFEECRDAFHWSLEEYIYFGGYPGAASLIRDEKRWSRYIIDSIIETSITRDVLLITQINKPILLRRVFELGCHYTGHIFSYQKMLGQLQDAGNVTTLAHYLELLSGAGLVTGLQRFSLDRALQKASSPKFQVFNSALATAKNHLSFENIQQDPEAWRNLITCSIGTHLINSALGSKLEIFYWAEENYEIDFVIRNDKSVLTLMVNPRKKGGRPGATEAFFRICGPHHNLIVGENGIPIDEFLLTPLDAWIDFNSENPKKSA